MQQPKFRIVLFRGRYYAAWREDGQIRRKALRTKYRDIAEQTLKTFAEQYEVANRPDVITVEFCWNGYRETLKGRPSYITMGYEALAILPVFGHLAADSITEQDCRDYQRRRHGFHIKDGTIWTELGRLRSALIWAAKRRIIASAPTIYRPPISLPRDQRLTRIQANTFVNACAMPHVRLFVILAMTTGARSGAILDLTWNRINFETGLIDLADPGKLRTKKGRPIVRMNATAMAALSEARTGATTPYVIEWAGRPVKSIKKGLQAAGRRCGLPWVTAHVFRHSVASWLAQDGIDLRKIAAMLGHTDSRMTERVYAKFSPDYLKDAADALEIGLVQEKRKAK